MAQNLVIDVLLANLMVSKSPRITEISLGIIGNLACHEILREQISSSNGLVKVIVDQLFSDDVPSLCEAFRVITTFLRNSDGCVVWAEALQTEQILSRILWISDNTLNRKLIGKSTRFLFDVLSCQQVAAILLPPMMKLGLSSLLLNLLAFELSKFREEEKPESDEVLDYILLSIEALSVMDDYLEEMCLNKQLLQLLEDLIKFHDKFEIPNACVTASTLLAKIVARATSLASEMSQDLDVLQGLLDAFPFASSVLTQASMWCFIARLLTLVRESEVSSLFLNRLVSILTKKFDLLEEEITIHLLNDMDDDPPPTAYVDALVIG
ncbi:ARM repeat superfamily protein isoform 1 [Dorcoceras hygrometricum]|uniref:ARM repeat superfamily protein isoform 1 n=1 Tax=Dorcoceras hygrometricum TaxID=472368 RepID=A0A2Z7AG06_9LAMI|nr:ARM repeat superfamily protein isoform 1 [Dorcoceras hygrometricum]